MKNDADYRIVIPARMTSERLPGKPLLPIAGRCLIEHVWRRARESSAGAIVIATDDEQVRQTAAGFGAEVVMTSVAHRSGSDRIAECADQLGWANDALIVNLQGDEPLMPAACLDQTAQLLAADRDADVASLYWPVESEEEVTDPNVVKVVLDESGAALYFSRSAIPHPRHWGSIGKALADGCFWKRHIGLYAYRAGALRAFAASQATPLEKAERLEQLRILESGGRIVMAQACQFIPAGVDTADDLRRVSQIILELF
jgi:3-deoxy-manno-octulosonate cytidylyltransferase (CMP-KDO synthetase)